MVREYLGNIKGEKGEKGDYPDDMNRFFFSRFNEKDIVGGVIENLDNLRVITNTESLNGSDLSLTEGYWLLNLFVQVDNPDLETVHLYFRVNGTNFISRWSNKETINFELNMGFASNPGDIYNFRVYHNGNGDVTLRDLNSGYISAKYISPL